MERDSGFTLVELLVVMTIVGVILGGLYSVFQTSSRTYVVQDRAAVMQQDARFGVDYLADLIRAAGYDPRGKGGNRFGFQVAQDWDGKGPQSCDGKNVAFTADDNQDGLLDTNDSERVAFRLSGGELQRYRNGSGWEPIVVGVDDDGSSFAYVYADGSRDSTPSADKVKQIRAVQITLQMRAPELFGAQIREKRYTTLVKCRNLGLK
jgi:prepilin-type N-terminal cleavage/methylation domain-containing protein